MNANELAQALELVFQCSRVARGQSPELQVAFGLVMQAGYAHVAHLRSQQPETEEQRAKDDPYGCRWFLAKARDAEGGKS